MFGKVIGIFTWYVTLIVMWCSILTFPVLLFWPSYINYDCLGTNPQIEDGEFKVINNETHEVEQYSHRITYRDFDGNPQTAYVGGNMFDNWSIEHIKDNDYHFMYKYRWWTFALFYLMFGLVLLIIVASTYSSMDDAKTVIGARRQERKNRKSPKVKVKELLNSIH